MSRIGKKIIPVPAGVKVGVKDGNVQVEGPKGKLSLKLRPEIQAAFDDAAKAIKVTTSDESGESNKYWGTSRALLRNMVEGVTKGYEKNLQVVGTGWSAAVTGKQLKLVVGFANPILLNIPEGLTVAVDKAQGDTTPIKITGTDRQLVGQFASAVRQQRKPEPYNGKGIKFAEEVIKRKQGKQFGA